MRPWCGAGPRLALVAALGFAAASALAASEVAPTGSLCIAPFHVEDPPSLDPIMSPTTWPPGPGSSFEFRIDGREKIAVREGEMVSVRDLPVDRKVKVVVHLDGKPFETFRLELGKKPGNRICLWLYEGYWHWIDNGWHAELGCRCDEAGEQR